MCKKQGPSNSKNQLMPHHQISSDAYFVNFMNKIWRQRNLTMSRQMVSRTVLLMAIIRIKLPPKSNFSPLETDQSRRFLLFGNEWTLEVYYLIAKKFFPSIATNSKWGNRIDLFLHAICKIGLTRLTAIRSIFALTTYHTYIY